jgi:hypothetical protein
MWDTARVWSARHINSRATPKRFHKGRIRIGARSLFERRRDNRSSCKAHPSHGRRSAPCFASTSPRPARICRCELSRNSQRQTIKLNLRIACPLLTWRPERNSATTHVKAHRCAGGGKRGAAEQAIGVTRGGRNSKVHALVDKFCRPWVIILTPGNVANCTVALECLSLMADSIKKLLGDKAYDRNSFRKSLREDGITPVIRAGKIARNASIVPQTVEIDRILVPCARDRRRAPITISNISCRTRSGSRRSGIAAVSRRHTPSLRSASRNSSKPPSEDCRRQPQAIDNFVVPRGRVKIYVIVGVVRIVRVVVAKINIIPRTVGIPLKAGRHRRFRRTGPERGVVSSSSPA